MITTNNLIIPIAIGFIAGIPIYCFLLKKVPGLNTFEHEFTHAFVAILFGGKINKFVSTKYEGGYVNYQGLKLGRLGFDMAGFAPYVLPTFTFLSVIFFPLIPLNIRFYYLIWIGFTLFYHTASTFEETIINFHTRTFRRARTNQYTKSDLGSRGLLYSAISIVFFTIFIHLIIFQIVVNGYNGVWQNIKLLGIGFYKNLFLVIYSVSEFMKNMIDKLRLNILCINPDNIWRSILLSYIYS